jgi:hypothetical protein
MPAAVASCYSYGPPFISAIFHGHRQQYMSGGLYRVYYLLALVARIYLTFCFLLLSQIVPGGFHINGPGVFRHTRGLVFRVPFVVALFPFVSPSFLFVAPLACAYWFCAL